MEMESSTVSSLATTENYVSVDTLSDIARFYLENRGVLIFTMFFFFLNSCLAILGNSLVIYLILTRSSLKNSGNILLANLAVTDILFGFLEVSMFQRTVDQYYDPQNAEFSPVPDWICSLEGIALTCILLSSVYNMTAIAVNRYICVCRHNNYGRLCSRMVIIVVAVAIWPLCILFSVPALFMGDGMVYNHLYVTCSFDQENDDTQMLFLTVVSFIIPSTIIVQSYLKIYKTVKESKTKMQTHSSVEGKASQTKQQVLSRFMAYCFFMLLWVPPALISTVNMFVNIPLGWKMCVGNMVSMTSSINPILYGLFNNHFKKEYIKLAKKFTCAFKGKNAVHAQVSSTHGEATTRQSRI